MVKRVDFVLRKNIFIIIFIILFIIMCLVIKNNYADAIFRLDSNVKNAVDYNIISDLLTKIMKIITHTGSAVAVITTLVLTVLLFKDRIIKTILLLDVVSIEIIKAITKLIIARPRPVLSLIKMPTDYSFPSGHTFFAVGFYGLIIYFILKSKLSILNKTIFAIIILLLILLIAFSRIYLGVHYFTDVICGFSLGVFILLFFISTYLCLKED